MAVAATGGLATLLTLNNNVFRAYLFWSGVLLLKMLLMSIFTGLQRFKTRCFANPEDCLSRKDKVKYDEPDVERVRRAHLNDMENILPFVLIGFFYVLTNPTASLAINLFRAVGISRLIHTFVYAIVVLPQPSRVLAFGVAYAANIYMAIRVIFYTV